MARQIKEKVPPVTDLNQNVETKCNFKRKVTELKIYSSKEYKKLVKNEFSRYVANTTILKLQNFSGNITSDYCFCFYF